MHGFFEFEIEVFEDLELLEEDSCVFLMNNLYKNSFPQKPLIPSLRIQRRQIIPSPYLLKIPHPNRPRQPIKILIQLNPPSLALQSRQRMLLPIHKILNLSLMQLQLLLLPVSFRQSEQSSRYLPFIQILKNFPKLKSRASRPPF